MKRIIGLFALVVALICFVVFMSAVSSANHDLAGSVMPIYGVCMAVACFCLAGDVIRYVGKMFAQGMNGGTANHTCPNCGKRLRSDAKFCDNCGHQIR